MTAIDPRATSRGVTVETPPGAPLTWRVVRIDWLDAEQSQGRHHIYANVLDESGARLIGIPLLVTWPTGASRIVTEHKPEPEYCANFPMSPSRSEFSIKVDGLALSESVHGIGMGADTQGGFNSAIHTSTVVVFQRGATTSTPPTPPSLSVRETLERIRQLATAALELL